MYIMVCVRINQPASDDAAAAAVTIFDRPFRLRLYTYFTDEVGFSNTSSATGNTSRTLAGYAGILWMAV